LILNAGKRSTIDSSYIQKSFHHSSETTTTINHDDHYIQAHRHNVLHGQAVD